uniref:Uncharacterized protein n=1 Tax=Cannabis sativa TaxID=3483 RepID=A0A803Q786_CANSA
MDSELLASLISSKIFLLQSANHCSSTFIAFKASATVMVVMSSFTSSQSPQINSWMLSFIEIASMLWWGAIRPSSQRLLVVTIWATCQLFGVSLQPVEASLLLMIPHGLRFNLVEIQDLLSSWDTWSLGQHPKRTSEPNEGNRGQAQVQQDPQRRYLPFSFRQTFRQGQPVSGSSPSTAFLEGQTACS